MQEWIKLPYFLKYMPGHYRYFFYDALEPALKRGGLFIVAMHAASIKTTRLSRKDCLAGYRYEKAAVITVIPNSH